MKFFVVLIILLNQAPIPKVYTYQFMTFNEIETCEVFIKTKRINIDSIPRIAEKISALDSEIFPCGSGLAFVRDIC